MPVSCALLTPCWHKVSSNRYNTLSKEAGSQSRPPLFYGSPCLPPPLSAHPQPSAAHPVSPASKPRPPCGVSRKSMPPNLGHLLAQVASPCLPSSATLRRRRQVYASSCGYYHHPSFLLLRRVAHASVARRRFLRDGRSLSCLPILQPPATCRTRGRCASWVSPRRVVPFLLVRPTNSCDVLLTRPLPVVGQRPCEIEKEVRWRGYNSKTPNRPLVVYPAIPHVYPNHPS